MRKLLLPSLAAFLLFSNVLSAQCTKTSRDGVHVVQYGETLYKISRLYNVTIDELRTWNTMQFNELLSVCQELQIRNTTTTSQVIATAPVPDVLTTRTVIETPPPTSTINYTFHQRQSGGRHVIQTGETIAQIAGLYGYTEARFREFNALLPEQELPTSSVLLTSDCPCNRISYADQSQGLFQGNWNGQIIQQDNEYYHKKYNGGIPTTIANDDNYINEYYTPPSQNTTPTNTNPQEGTRWSQVPPRSTPPPPTPQGNDWRRTSPSSPTSNTPPPSSRPVNTGKPTSTYMSNEEQQMINEINLVRSNPAGYVRYVEQYIQDINNGRAFGSSTTVAYELIDELKRTPPLSVLQPSECLYQAARQHGQEAVRTGASGHQGQDGSWPWDRAKRACPSMQDGNEKQRAPKNTATTRLAICSLL